MKKLIALLPLVVLCLMMGCTTPSGVEVTQYFPINNNYINLYISDGMLVTVSDDVDEVVITGDENVMEKVKVESSSNNLRIYRKDIAIAYPTKTEVLIPHNASLRKVEVNMDSEFSTGYGLAGDEITVQVESRSKFFGYIMAEKLNLKIADNSDAYVTFDVYELMNLRMSGSSSADLDGDAENVSLDIQDNSSNENNWNSGYYAFSCDECYGNINNNCKLYINCFSEISVNLSNNSFLHYTSNPYVDDSYVDGTSGLIYDGYKK